MNTLLALFNTFTTGSQKVKHSSVFDYDHIDRIELVSDKTDPMIITLEEEKKNLIEKITPYFADIGHTLRIVSKQIHYAYIFDKNKNKILIQRNKISFINRTGRERYCVKRIEFYLENNNGVIGYVVNSKTRDYVVRVPINCYKYRDERDTYNSKDKFEHFISLKKDEEVIKPTLEKGYNDLKFLLLDLYRPGKHYIHKVSLIGHIKSTFFHKQPKKPSTPVRLLLKR